MEPIKTKQIGDYKISVFYDLNAECPCTNWDMAACYLFCYSDSQKLHRDCNWSNEGDTIQKALVWLIYENVKWKDLLNYFKQGEVDEYRMRYDKSEHLWFLEYYDTWRTGGSWYSWKEFEPCSLKEYNLTFEFCEDLDKDQLLQILQDIGKDIFVSEWSTRGYCQGDYCEGVAFCTKERYKKYVSNDTTDWKEKIQKLIDDEVKCIEKWMWGDVLGYTIEKKVHFTKHYDEGKCVDNYEWEFVDGCYGNYMEPDEIFDMVISEHNLRETA